MPKRTNRGISTPNMSEAPTQHPREVTGRPPTFSDLSPSGRRKASSRFSEIATNPSSGAAAASENAASRVTNWREKNPGKEDNTYISGQDRRAGQMRNASLMTTDRSRPVTMHAAATRIADNYAIAGQRTQAGDIGLTEEDVGVSSLSSTTAASVRNAQSGRGTSFPAGADWYLSHGAELANVSRATGVDQRAVVIGSSSMSPQNDPVQERQAAAAISYAHAGNREVSMQARDKKATPKEQRAHSQAIEAVGIPAGTSKQFSELTVDQVAKTPKHRAFLAGEANIGGIAKGGTEVPTGVGMIRGNKTQEDLGPTGKVVSYAHHGALGSGLDSLGEKAPDANDIGEFNRRVHESIPGNAPYHEQPTLFGKAWEADPYGRAHSTTGILNPGHQPEEAPKPSRAASKWFPESTAEHRANPPERHEGTSPMDTWMMAQALTLPRKVEGESISTGGVTPAVLSKGLASDSDVMKFGSGDEFLPTGTGERKITGAEVQHATFNEINNQAAGIVTDRARAAGRNVGAGVPAIAVQAGSWTGYRMEQDKDPDYSRRQSFIAGQGVPNAAVPGKTPKPGQDVPMFDESNTPLDYGKTWRPKRRG